MAEPREYQLILDLLGKQLKQEQQINDEIKSRITLSDEQAKAYGKLIASLEEEISMLKTLNSAKAAGSKIADQELKVRNKQLELEVDNLALLEKSIELLGIEEERKQEILSAQMQIVEAIEETNNAFANGVEQGKKLSALFGKDSSFVKTIDNLRNFGQFFDGFKKGVGDLFSISTIGAVTAATGFTMLSKSVSESTRMFESFLSAQKEITAAYGYINVQALDNINGINSSGKALITYSEAAKAVTAVADTYATSTEAIEYGSIRSAAALEKFGMSMSDLTKRAIILSSTIEGSSVQSNIRLQTGIISLAKQTNLASKTLYKDFGDALEVMITNGANVEEQFVSLTGVISGFKMSASEIISITDKFDTFDSAAQSVGKLNALLGGQFLSAIEMIETTDPAQRFLKISDALKETGKSFDQMEYYEKKAIAGALGLERVSQLALIMSGDVKQLGEGFNMTAASAAELEEAMAKGQTVAEKFQKIFLAAEPFVTSFLNGVIGILDSLGEFGTTAFLTITGVMVLVGGVASAMRNTATLTYDVARALSVVRQEGLKKGLASLAGAEGAAPAAATAAAGGTGAVATSVSAASYTALNAEVALLNTNLGVLTTTLATVDVALQTQVGFLGEATLAYKAMAAAAAEASAATGGGSLAPAGAAKGGFVGAMATFTEAMIAAAPGLVLFTTGLLGVGLGIAAIGGGIYVIGLGLQAGVSAIVDLVGLGTDILTSAGSFAALAASLGLVATAMGTVVASAVVGVPVLKGLFSAATEYENAVAASAAVSVPQSAGPVVQTTTPTGGSAATVGTGGVAGGAGNVVIQSNLILDGRVLATAVNDIKLEAGSNMTTSVLQTVGGTR